MSKDAVLPEEERVEDPAVTACRERGMALLKQYAPDSYLLVTYYYLGPGQQLLVLYTDKFPANEFDPYVPEEIKKTSRYDLYVLGKYPSGEMGSYRTGTHVYGIYGLLNEFCAYSWTCRTDLALLNYYSGLQDLDGQTIKYNIDRVEDTYLAYLEFKYFILKYLLYAREYKPSVYREIIGNSRLRMAFTAIDTIYYETTNRFYEAVESFIKDLPERGMRVIKKALTGVTNRLSRSSPDRSSGKYSTC